MVQSTLSGCTRVCLCVSVGVHVAVFVCVCHTGGDSVGVNSHRWPAVSAVPNLGMLCVPRRSQYGLHTGVRRSWHHGAGGAWPPVPRRCLSALCVSPTSWLLSPALDSSSSCHVGVLSHLCLSLPQGPPGTQWCLDGGCLPLSCAVLLKETALSRALARGRDSGPTGVLAAPVAQ